MLQKTQWTLAATVVAISACLVAGARPAQAQVRIHLTRGSAVTTHSTGIITPPSSPGIVTPPSSPGIVTPPSSSGIVTPPSPPSNPTVTPSTSPTTSTRGHSITPTVTPPAPVVSVHSAGQGFSAGPSLLGDMRLPLGRFVDRVGPQIIGNNGPTVQKVIAHH